jgi:6-phosphogluconolactonase (cycloisomerase 2 family)
MLDRRAFTALLAGTVAAPRMTLAQASKSVYYAATGPELALYEIDFADGALQKRASYALPANIQYAWPHPSKQFFYVVSSAGGPGVASDKNFANAFRLDRATGALTPHGEPAPLRQRPIHASVDRTGEFLLTAYNTPSTVTVHRIKADGTIGEEVAQPEKLATGIYAHQILATPANQTVILVSRGNNAAAGKPEDPGSLHVFGLKSGVLGNIATVRPGDGLGFGPRHLDFHPDKPWVYVSVERQNQLYAYALGSDGALARDPAFIKSTLADRANVKPAQGAGPIHVHPNGRFVYVTNRNQGEVEVDGKKVFNDGENNVAVFAIDQQSGEPTQIQTIEGHGIHLRNFGIDPQARLLIASSIRPMPLRDGKTLTAGLMVYRLGGDGKLTFVRKYDVDTGKGQQFWSGLVTLG